MYLILNTVNKEDIQFPGPVLGSVLDLEFLMELGLSRWIPERVYHLTSRHQIITHNQK
jgi:hypothetical protein